MHLLIKTFCDFYVLVSCTLSISLISLLQRRDLFQFQKEIKSLPLDYWSISTFEAVGAYFGGLENIATETNLLNCLEAKIQVKKNLYGFMLPTIEIEYEKRDNIF